MHYLANLPFGRRRLLNFGTLLALCVYYLNYGAIFDEGEVEGMSALTTLMRISSVVIILLAVSPLRFRPSVLWGYVILYLAGAFNLMFAVGVQGNLNDSLYFNTLLQLPILVALYGARWQIDYPRWMRFISIVLAVQVFIDVLVWQAGESLWLSSAFIGGVGNPSSFGLLCAVSMAFCFFHPCSGRGRWVLAAILAVGAVQTKSLFAVLAVTVIAAVWMVMERRRVLIGLFGVSGLLIALTLQVGAGDGEDTSFVEHKLNAVGALIGLIDYDVDSSASVAQRMAMHDTTFVAIADAPVQLLWGHLEGLAYWPMDSQLLTYLGTFGAPFLVFFIIFHLYWMWLAWRVRQVDNGFALLTLSLFGLIFTTNRILDYFPIAILYFLVVMSVLHIESTNY